MSYGFIKAEDFSFNTLLLMDRWLIRQISGNKDPEFRRHLGIALAGNPTTYWYVVNVCPEAGPTYRQLLAAAPQNPSPAEVRASEVYVLDAIDWAVVYVYPELTDSLPYVRDWDPARLLELADFQAKTVLDIGSGTGRLALAAAPLARYVYALEPTARFREYLKEKLHKLNINNVYVIDGTIESIPFPDWSFDIVMSGHVTGDDLRTEYREMDRVTRPGGFIIDCPGEDDRPKPGGPSRQMLGLGFSVSHYKSKNGGDVYRYIKQKQGKNQP